MVFATVNVPCSVNVCVPVMEYTLGLLASWVIVPAAGLGVGSPSMNRCRRSAAPVGWG